MDNTEFTDPRLVQSFQSTYPKVNVRIYRILYEHRYVLAFQRVCYFLDKERAGCGPGTYPDHIHAIFQTVKHVFLPGDFRSHLHAELILYSLQPLESGCSHAFKCIRMGTRFPDSSPEDIDTERF